MFYKHVNWFLVKDCAQIGFDGISQLTIARQTDDDDFKRETTFHSWKYNWSFALTHP